MDPPTKFNNCSFFSLPKRCGHEKQQLRKRNASQLENDKTKLVNTRSFPATHRPSSASHQGLAYFYRLLDVIEERLQELLETFNHVIETSRCC
jgi:hypothetical protein